MRRTAAAVVVVVLAAGVVGCGSRVDDEAAPGASGTGGPTSTAPAGGGSPTTAVAGTATTTADGGPSPSGVDSTATTTAPAGSTTVPGPVVPAPAPVGRYAYDAAGHIEVAGAIPPRRDLADTGSLDVSDERPGTQRATLAVLDERGDGIVTEQVLTYDGVGVVLEAVAFQGRFQGYEERRSVQLAEPVRIVDPGTTGEPVPFSHTQDGTTYSGSAVVLERAERTVGDRRLPCVRVVSDLTVAGPDINMRVHVDGWIWLAHYLPVEITGTAEGTVRIFEVDSEFSARLRSTEPSAVSPGG